MTEERRTVHVDAKIVGAERGKKRAFVGYIVKSNEEKLFGAIDVSASETDQAEAAAILFAIRSLTKQGLKNLMIICDHESVVLKANWSKVLRERRKVDPVFRDLWAEMDRNPEVTIKPIGTNQAHAFLNKWLKEKGFV
jgi:ribonuclease HI